MTFVAQTVDKDTELQVLALWEYRSAANLHLMPRDREQQHYAIPSCLVTVYSPTKANKDTGWSSQ